MNDLEIGYLAGLIDGEGSIILEKDGQTVRVSSTDYEIVERAFIYSGMGAISGPYQYDSERKPAWYWSVHDRNNVYELLTVIKPHMCQRRKDSIDAVLGYIESRRKSMARTCLTCENEYEVKLNGRGSYCSKECWKINYYQNGVRI